MKVRPIARVIVEQAPQRKGWHWRQVTGNGSTAAVSPKFYDTKALAKRAGQRQVDVLNHFCSNGLVVDGNAVLPPAASILVLEEDK